MAGEWSVKTIGECASTEPYSTQIGPFGKALMADEYVNSGVPVLRGVNVNRGRFHDGDFVFIDNETADRLGKFECYPGDVLLVHKGTLGQIGLMPSKRRYPRYIMGNSMMRVRCDPAKLLPEYLYYWLSSAAGQQYLFSRVSQVGVPQLQTPLTTLRQAELPVPPLVEQRAIAHILSTMDDKIELNQRMTETLEAMARALVKSWFLDFDPVRAKAEGRDPGLPHHIADLFPDSFEDSELGEIPKGWTIGKVARLCDAIYSGGTPNTQNPEYWDGDVPWLSSGETRETFIIDTERRITTTGVANSSTRLAPAMSTVIASAGQGNTRGQTSLLAIDSYVNQSVVVLTANRHTSTPCHLFFDLERRYEEFRRVSDGHSSRGSLTTKLLAGLDTVIPPHPIVQCLDTVLASMVERSIHNLRESRSLAALHDALLPKLISGELRVQAAEKFVARAAS